MMQMVLDVIGRKRPIISLPFAIGMLQGFVLEKLPLNLFTVTRAQVRSLVLTSVIYSAFTQVFIQIEQLKTDNIVNHERPATHISLANVLSSYSDEPLESIQKILPSYLR